MDRYTGELKRIVHEWGAFVKWAVLSAAIGAVVGLAAVAFHWSIDAATALRKTYPWMIWLLPAAGAAIALCYQWCGMDHDKGTNQILLAVRDDEPVKLRMAPLIFFSTVATHLAGGSAGREGAALQLGGSLASWTGTKLGLDGRDRRILVMCGMAAAFSALFGTPITAAVFSIEVASVGVMYFGAIVPCLVASISSFLLAQALGLHSLVGYDAGTAAVLNSGNMLRTLLLGMGCAAVSVLFCVAMHLSQKLYKRYFKNQVLRAAAGGAMVLVLTLLLGTRDYCGAGDELIRKLLREPGQWYVFLLKIIMTALTLGAGFRGGEIVPALCVGCAFGTWLGGLIGFPTAFAGAMGMAAVFCGVTNCPVTSFLLSFELFGGEGMILYSLCCGVSYMLSGYYGLYSAQKLIFSKFRPEEVDQSAR